MRQEGADVVVASAGCRGRGRGAGMRELDSLAQLLFERPDALVEAVLGAHGAAEGQGDAMARAVGGEPQGPFACQAGRGEGALPRRGGTHFHAARLRQHPHLLFPGDVGPRPGGGDPAAIRCYRVPPGGFAWAVTAQMTGDTGGSHVPLLRDSKSHHFRPEVPNASDMKQPHAMTCCSGCGRKVASCTRAQPSCVGQGFALAAGCP